MKAGGESLFCPSLTHPSWSKHLWIGFQKRYCLSRLPPLRLGCVRGYKEKGGQLVANTFCSLVYRRHLLLPHLVLSTKYMGNRKQSFLLFFSLLVGVLSGGPRLPRGVASGLDSQRRAPAGGHQPHAEGGRGRRGLRRQLQLLPEERGGVEQGRGGLEGRCEIQQMINFPPPNI